MRVDTPMDTPCIKMVNLRIRPSNYTTGEEKDLALFDSRFSELRVGKPLDNIGGLSAFAGMAQTLLAIHGTAGDNPSYFASIMRPFKISRVLQ